MGPVEKITASELIKSIEKDGWERQIKRGAIQSLKKGDRAITIHFHPKKTYQPKLLKMLLNQTGWNEDDLRRLKLIK